MGRPLSGRGAEQDRVRLLLEGRIRKLLRRRRAALRRRTPGSIHDLRVAARRMQEVLKVFAARLPRRERDRLWRRARSLRRQLTDLRDADVNLHLLRRLRAGGVLPPRATGAALLERRLLERARALRKGQDVRMQRNGAPGEGLRIRGIRKRAKALLDSLTRPDGVRAGIDSDRILASRIRVVRREMRRASSLRAGDLHRLRIAVKRYRYTLETLEDWGMKGLSRTIGAARGLQEKLGHVHDLDVLIEFVRRTRTPGLLAHLRVKRLHLAERARVAMTGFRYADQRQGA